MGRLLTEQAPHRTPGECPKGKGSPQPGQGASTRGNRFAQLWQRSIDKPLGRAQQMHIPGHSASWANFSHLFRKGRGLVDIWRSAPTITALHFRPPRDRKSVV